VHVRVLACMHAYVLAAVEASHINSHILKQTHNANTHAQTHNTHNTRTRALSLSLGDDLGFVVLCTDTRTFTYTHTYPSLIRKASPELFFLYRYYLF